MVKRALIWLFKSASGPALKKGDSDHNKTTNDLNTHLSFSSSHIVIKDCSRCTSGPALRKGVSYHNKTANHSNTHLSFSSSHIGIKDCSKCTSGPALSKGIRAAYEAKRCIVHVDVCMCMRYSKCT